MLRRWINQSVGVVITAAPTPPRRGFQFERNKQGYSYFTLVSTKVAMQG